MELHLFDNLFLPFTGEIKGVRLPHRGTSFDELWLIMIGFDRGKRAD